MVVDFALRADRHYDVGERPRLAQENEPLLHLFLRKEDLSALIDPAFQNPRATHPTRAHAASEIQLGAALQRRVEDRSIAICCEAEFAAARHATIKWRAKTSGGHACGSPASSQSRR